MRSALLALLLAALAATAFAGEPRLLLQQSPVMGFRHHEGKRLWNELHVGDELTLTREPDNPYDSQAIRVEWRGHKLGYVPRAENADLARLIDHGNRVQARIIALEKRRRPNNRVRMEIFMGLRAKG